MTTGWRVFVDTGGGQTGVSGAYRSREGALNFAQALIEAGVAVLSVEGPNESIGAEEVAALCGRQGGVSRRWQEAAE